LTGTLHDQRVVDRFQLQFLRYQRPVSEQTCSRDVGIGNDRALAANHARSDRGTDTEVPHIRSAQFEWPLRFFLPFSNPKIDTAFRPWWRSQVLWLRRNRRRRFAPSAFVGDTARRRAATPSAELWVNMRRKSIVRLTDIHFSNNRPTVLGNLRWNLIRHY